MLSLAGEDFGVRCVAQAQLLASKASSRGLKSAMRLRTGVSQSSVLESKAERVLASVLLTASRLGDISFYYEHLVRYTQAGTSAAAAAAAPTSSLTP